MSLENISEEYGRVIEIISSRVESGEDLLRVVQDYSEFADDFGIGMMGLAYYVNEYNKIGG